MIALETIAASATAPGAGGAAMAAVTGDSLRIRDASAAYLIGVSQFQQADGRVRITSPLLHDNTVGIKYEATAANRQWSGFPTPQKLTPQDTLSLNAIGSAVAGDVELFAMSIMYENLAGINANLIDNRELQSRAIEVFQPEVSLTGTAAGWTGTQVLTTTDDAYKANEEYAWIGIGGRAVSNFFGLGMVSPDWGNLRIFCPLQAGTNNNIGYFSKMADITQMPCIPVLNASQKSNIFLTLLQNENNATGVANLMLVRLSQKRGRK